MAMKEKVKQMRETLGYSQSELARKAQTTAATISRLESGKTLQLKSEALSRLARALNLSVDDLISNDLKKKRFDPANYDPNLKPLLNIFSRLPREKRKLLLGFALYLSNENEIFHNYAREDLAEYAKE